MSADEIPSQPYVWRFEPDSEPSEPTPMVSVREAYEKPVKQKKPPSWTAPEHNKMTRDMRKDYVRNEKGEPVSKTRELVVDKRPTILIPPRPTRLGWL